MLLEKHDHPFDSDRYIFEPKIDGHRAILTHFSGKTNIFTRNGNNITRQYPELESLTWGHDVVLDGEIACINNATGKIDYESVMIRLKSKKRNKIQLLTGILPINFIVFDILWYRDRDLRSLPLLQRKSILSHVCIAQQTQTGIIPVIEDTGTVLFDYIQSQSMEGIVAKLKESIYVGKRSSSWLKIINWSYTTVYLTGFHKKGLGWNTAVLMENGQYRETGIIQYGMTRTHIEKFRLFCIDNLFKEDNDYIYVKPILQANVKIRNWTSSGMLRIPIFIDFV